MTPIDEITNLFGKEDYSMYDDELFCWIKVFILVLLLLFIIWHGFKIEIGDIFSFEIYPLKSFL